MRTIVKALFVLVLGSTPGALAQAVVPLVVVGNELQGTINLPGGIGATLTIDFENTLGLTPTALQASAMLVSPIDPTLLSRLPAGVSVLEAFPLLVAIGPAAGSGLSFSGEYTISFHTFNLQLNPLIPLSLLKSPDGGSFQDITKYEGKGSYRDGGTGGDFSQFMIILDTRPIDTVIDGKFEALNALIANNAASIPPDVVSTLQALLSQARSFYGSGDVPDAVNQVTAFAACVKAHSGQDIPDVWRANDPSIVNIAGLLRSGADTLNFSLNRK
jgi:hypothetical protein